MTNIKIYVAVNPEKEECYAFHKFDEIKNFVVMEVLKDTDTYMDDYIDYIKDTAIDECLISPQSAFAFVYDAFEDYFEASIATFYGWYVYETVLL